MFSTVHFITSIDKVQSNTTSNICIAKRCFKHILAIQILIVVFECTLSRLVILSTLCLTAFYRCLWSYQHNGDVSREDKLRQQTGEFAWDEETQGHVLAAYYYGYVATQLMGGRLSETIGAKMVYGTGIMLSGVFTLMGPVAVRAKFYAFIAIRVLTGAASVWPNIQEVGMTRNKKSKWKI